MRAMHLLATSWVAAAVLGAAGPASADGAAASPESPTKSTTGADHIEHIGLTAGGAAMGSFYPRANEAMFGGGLSAFMPLIRHQLEVQLSVDFFRTESGNSLMPIDLFLRRPLYMSRIFEPYVAGGPRLELLTGAPKIGGGLAVGAQVWLAQNVGLFLEAQANLMGNRTVTPEAGTTGGVALGL